MFPFNNQILESILSLSSFKDLIDHLKSVILSLDIFISHSKDSISFSSSSFCFKFFSLIVEI